MLVWLASYPRSGNTFVRTILKQSFGIRTSPLYGQGDGRSFETTELRELVGHVDPDLPPEELIERAQQSATPVIVKTHEPPVTSDKTIHIVRDGRSAIVSYLHYMRDIERLDFTLEAIIRGEVYAGSWSDHFRAWSEQPSRLLLKYEDIAADPSRTVALLSEFLALQPVSRYDLAFEELHELKPKFFRSGKNDLNIDEMGSHMPLFNELHGDVMRQLGYR